MSQVFTRPIGSGILPAGGDITLYTAAADGQTVLRDISVVNLAPATNTQLYVVHAGYNFAFYLAASTPALDTIHWEGRVALNPGDSLHAYIATGGQSMFWVTGYVFDT